ncbi:unnamed protein product [Rangifer tarandus platyrhynchus]|uniref:Uncharacterized protein n=2 Tax=Rangifer tarandus platyrhynchus TaxID=3082113 RepID=A0AC59ZZE0_RANTA|nr:unnamed protein product [Rangifer tarandus platyrhynchus]
MRGPWQKVTVEGSEKPFLCGLQTCRYPVLQAGLPFPLLQRKYCCSPCSREGTVVCPGPLEPPHLICWAKDWDSSIPGRSPPHPNSSYSLLQLEYLGSPSGLLGLWLLTWPA